MNILECADGCPLGMEYLGDGAYVGHDSIQLWLACERDGQVHKVALGASELMGLVSYARRVGLIGKSRDDER